MALQDSIIMRNTWKSLNLWVYHKMKVRGEKVSEPLKTSLPINK
jgi:hypothetical protein